MAAEALAVERQRVQSEPPTFGLAHVLHAAATEAGTHGPPCAGLTLLSHVAYDVGVAGVDNPIQPASMASAPRRVGLRPIENAARSAVTHLGSGTAASQPTAATYAYYCDQFDVKANSGMKRLLSQPGMQRPHEIVGIDCRGTFLGDRGVLPVLELARVCPNLVSLDFTENGLKNTAVEAIADFVISCGLEKFSRLSIAKNRVTIGAAIVLHEAARRNHKMVVIDVAGTRIDPGLAARLQEQVAANVAKADAAATTCAAAPPSPPPPPAK